MNPDELTELIYNMGRDLGFEPYYEVGASPSAYVDVVWFDERIPLKLWNIDQGKIAPKMREHPVLPVVAFEIERKTGLNAKHIKGSVSNLDNLGAQLGVLVIGQENMSNLGKRPPHTLQSPVELEEVLLKRIRAYVFDDYRPRSRIVVMTEWQVKRWADNVKAMHAQQAANK